MVIRWILVGLALLIAPPAFAHAFLERASPGAGAELRAAPPEVRITFTEGVEARFSSVEVRDAAGNQVKTGDPQSGDTRRVLIVSLPQLAPGTYTVIWHATSVDTHKTEGKYSFTVLP